MLTDNIMCQQLVDTLALNFSWYMKAVSLRHTLSGEKLR